MAQPSYVLVRKRTGTQEDVYCRSALHTTKGTAARSLWTRPGLTKKTATGRGAAVIVYLLRAQSWSQARGSRSRSSTRRMECDSMNSPGEFFRVIGFGRSVISRSVA